MYNLSLKTAATAVVLSFLGAAASASTIYIENFSGFSNAGGDKSYQNAGYLYDPAQATNGQCYDAICLNEFNGNSQGDPGIITNITETHNDNDETTEPDDNFTLLGHYLNYNGNVVNDGQNLFSIIVDGVDNPPVLSLDVNTDLLSQNPWWTSGVADVYSENGTLLTGDDILDFDSQGYFFVYDVALFDFTGATIQMRGLPTGGQMRVDCVALDHSGGNTPLDTSQGVLPAFNNCDPTVNPIPVPASLPLLLTGILGASALASRRRRARA